MSVIELNGKKYDVKTGQQIDKKGSAKASARQKEPAADSSTNEKKPKNLDRVTSTIDGISQVSGIRRNMPKPKPVRREVEVRDKSTSSDVHVRTKPSITLMRSAVKSLKKESEKPSEDIDKPVLPTFANKARGERAAKHKKHSLVSKFDSTDDNYEPRPITKHIGNVPLQAPPPNMDREESVTTEPQQSHQIFQAVMESSTSHEAKPLKAPKKVRRGLGIASVGLASLLLVGFFGLQNSHHLSIRVASQKAGISASYPSYTPAGFKMSDRITYSAGKVTTNFSSRVDDRNFTLTQQTAEWDDNQLVNRYVSPRSDQFSIVEEDGIQIYTFGSSATWINNGLWYVIDGEDSRLSQDQLVHIASSL